MTETKSENGRDGADALNGHAQPSTATSGDTRRCVDCGEPVQMRGVDRCDACVQAHYERTYGKDEEEAVERYYARRTAEIAATHGAAVQP